MKYKLLIALATLSFSTFSFADNYYGAIAYGSNGSNYAYFGIATNFYSFEEARAYAIQTCAHNCSDLRLNFTTGKCAVGTSGSNGQGINALVGSIGEPLAALKSYALASCSANKGINCKIETVGCNSPANS